MQAIVLDNPTQTDGLSLHLLQAASGGRWLVPPRQDGATPLGRIVVDSRQVQSGDVFWALPGEHHDGADFVDGAFARGAAGAVTPYGDVQPPTGRWVLAVDHAADALWRLAGWQRRRFTGQVVAVAGSVGKTITREMVRAVLDTQSLTVSSPDDDHQHHPAGLPLGMLQWRAAHRCAVVELDGARFGEIARQAELCRPQIGVVTRIAEARLAGLGSLRGVAEAQAELLAALPPGGWAVLCGDDPWHRQIGSQCRAKICWVGREGDNDLVATDIDSGDARLSFTVDGHRFVLPLWGRHHVGAALGAIAVGMICGVGWPQLQDALADFAPPARHCRVTRVGDVCLVDDTAAACPAAVRAALELLRELPATGQRIVVLGDMQDLGPTAPLWHRRAGEEVVTVCGADRLIACGDQASHAAAGAVAAGMPSEHAVVCGGLAAAADALAGVAAGDVILVTGSRGIKAENLVAAIQQRPPQPQAA